MPLGQNGEPRMPPLRAEREYLEECFSIHRKTDLLTRDDLIGLFFDKGLRNPGQFSANCNVFLL